MIFISRKGAKSQRVSGWARCAFYKVVGCLINCLISRKGAKPSRVFVWRDARFTRLSVVLSTVLSLAKAQSRKGYPAGRDARFTRLSVVLSTVLSLAKTQSRKGKTASLRLCERYYSSNFFLNSLKAAHRKNKETSLRICVFARDIFVKFLPKLPQSRTSQKQGNFFAALRLGERYYSSNFFLNSLKAAHRKNKETSLRLCVLARDIIRQISF